MKKLFVLSLMALLWVGGMMAQAPQKQGKKVAVYGVGFYNLENLFDTINANGSYDLEYSPAGAKKWDGRKYWAKIQNMAEVIASMKSKVLPLGPAILGVSEIENRTVLEDLVRDPQIAAWDLQIVHHDSPDRRGVDVGLLYNPRFFTVEGVTNHRLHIPNYERFRTRDQMCVVGRLGGERVAVIVNHWPSRMGGAEQSSYLREACGALNKQIADSLWKIDPNINIITMGDMNDDPMDKSCAVVLGAKKDKEGVEEHGFYNPWWKMLDKGIGTLVYDGAWNLFDQIIVSGGLIDGKEGTLQLWKNEVITREFMKDKQGKRQGYPLRTFASGMYLDGYSDHYPTMIYLIRR